MTTVLNPTAVTAVKDAASISYVTEQEAEKLGLEELRRLLALLETLRPEDWGKPTACTLWNVHDMVAHQAGAFASGTGYREMLRQYAVLPKNGLLEDAINARQVGERATRSPAELIAQIRATGEEAVSNWSYRFKPVKLLGIPHPVPGWLTVRHLMLVTHSRDTWMHRLDICRATGQPFEMTPEHDSRINELVVLDLAKGLARRNKAASFVLELTGLAGGHWKIGPGNPAAAIRMDILDFNIYASGRTTCEEAARQAVFSGDVESGRRAFRNFAVLY